MLGRQKSEAEDGYKVGPQNLRPEVTDFRQVVEKSQHFGLDRRLVRKTIRIQELNEKIQASFLQFQKKEQSKTATLDKCGGDLEIIARESLCILI